MFSVVRVGCVGVLLVAGGVLLKRVGGMIVLLELLVVCMLVRWLLCVMLMVMGSHRVVSGCVASLMMVFCGWLTVLFPAGGMLMFNGCWMVRACVPVI